MSAYYYGDAPKLTDDEFALLKEELIWNGSKVGGQHKGLSESASLWLLAAWMAAGACTRRLLSWATTHTVLLAQVAILDSDEQRFLEASQAYAKGTPIMSDSDFDTLKTDLRQRGSIVSAQVRAWVVLWVVLWGGSLSTSSCLQLPAHMSHVAAALLSRAHTVQGPRCSIRSKRMYSDAYPDYLRMTALNVPAALLCLGFLFSIDDITGRCEVGWVECGCVQCAQGLDRTLTRAFPTARLPHPQLPTRL
jgi:hypothetical protein